MPLVGILKLIFGVVSLLVLVAAGYLLWTWWDGRLVSAADGYQIVLVRDGWRLWCGLSFLAWSFLGRSIVLTLVAHGDTDQTRARREAGNVVEGPAGEALYVERRGTAKGPALIMTHGWGLDSTIWDYASRDLGARHRLVLWDLPGLGRSRAPSQAICLPAFAAALRRVVETTGDGKVVLVGHSIGAMAIQTLVRDDPAFVRDRVAGVVLFNTTYTNPLRTMIFSRLLLALQKPVIEPALRLAVWLQPLLWIGAWQSYLSGSAHLANRLGFGRFVTRSQLEHTTLLATRNPPAVQARGNLAMLHWDATDALRELDLPLLVVGGALDIITRPGAGVRIADAASASVEIVEGVNHMGFLERAGLYHEAVERFVAGLAPKSYPETALTRQEGGATDGVGA